MQNTNGIRNGESPDQTTVAQLVASPTADLGVTSSILAQSHTFMEIDRGHSPPSTDSRRAVVSYKQMYTCAQCNG